MSYDIYYTGQKPVLYDSQCRKQSASFLLNLHLKSNKRRENSHCVSVLENSALPNRVYINYIASEASTMKRGHGRFFYADEKQLGTKEGGVGEKEEGLQVFQADKNGNVPLASQHPFIKASCWALGKGEGEER